MPPDPVKSFLKVQEGDRQRSLGPLRPVNEVSIERHIVQDATPWYEASLCLTTVRVTVGKRGLIRAAIAAAQIL